MSKQSTLLFVIQRNERLYYYHGLCIWTGSSRTHFIYEVLEDLQPPFCSLLKDFSLPHQAFSEPNTHICTTLTSDPNLSWIYKHTHTHNKNASLVVTLHLREELWELSADFISDSGLQEQVLRPLLLQLYLQLFQQNRLALRNGTNGITQWFKEFST